MVLNDKEIGVRIKNVREAYDLTQTQFASRLHMAQQTLSRYENGKSVPHEIIEDIAREFDISLNYFFGIDTMDFSEDELLLIELYRKSNQKIRKKMLDLIKVMTDD